MTIMRIDYIANTLGLLWLAGLAAALALLGPLA